MLALWLPILISTVALFVASFLSWMVFRLHEKDWIKAAGEDKLIDTIREMDLPEGNYMFPGTESSSEMSSPEYQEKYKAGPRGLLQVLPKANMGMNLGLTILYFLFCNATFAYLASFALNRPGIDPITVFRFVSTVALLTFCASMIQHAIWFKNRVVGHVIESVTYALVAGAIFAACWPTS